MKKKFFGGYEPVFWNRSCFVHALMASGFGLLLILGLVDSRLACYSCTSQLYQLLGHTMYISRPSFYASIFCGYVTARDYVFLESFHSLTVLEYKSTRLMPIV